MTGYTITNQYRIYHSDGFKVYALDTLTGVAHKATPVGKAKAADHREHIRVYGEVGYLDDEYNVYRIDDLGIEFVYPFSYGYASHEDAKAAWHKPVETEEMAQVEVKHDGLDNLRSELSPRVMMTVEQPFSDQFVITLSIPDPMQFHPSAFAKAFMNTKVRLSTYYADSKRWDGEKRALPAMETWQNEVQQRARALLAQARRDPVAFFEDREV